MRGIFVAFLCAEICIQFCPVLGRTFGFRVERDTFYENDQPVSRSEDRSPFATSISFWTPPRPPGEPIIHLQDVEFRLAQDAITSPCGPLSGGRLLFLDTGWPARCASAIFGYSATALPDGENRPTIARGAFVLASASRDIYGPPRDDGPLLVQAIVWRRSILPWLGNVAFFFVTIRVLALLRHRLIGTDVRSARTLLIRIGAVATTCAVAISVGIPLVSP